MHCEYYGRSLIMSQYSSVSKVTGYRVDDQGSVSLHIRNSLSTMFWLWILPNLQFSGSQELSFWECSTQSLKLVTHVHVMPRSKICEALLSCHLYTFMTVCTGTGATFILQILINNYYLFLPNCIYLFVNFASLYALLICIHIQILWLENCKKNAAWIHKKCSKSWKYSRMSLHWKTLWEYRNPITVKSYPGCAIPTNKYLPTA